MIGMKLQETLSNKQGQLFDRETRKRAIQELALDSPILSKCLAVCESGGVSWEDTMELAVCFLTQNNIEQREQFARVAILYGPGPLTIVGGVDNEKANTKAAGGETPAATSEPKD